MSIIGQFPGISEELPEGIVGQLCYTDCEDILNLTNVETIPDEVEIYRTITESCKILDVNLYATGISYVTSGGKVCRTYWDGYSGWSGSFNSAVNGSSANCIAYGSTVKHLANGATKYTHYHDTDIVYVSGSLYESLSVDANGVVHYYDCSVYNSETGEYEGKLKWTVTHKGCTSAYYFETTIAVGSVLKMLCPITGKTLDEYDLGHDIREVSSGVCYCDDGYVFYFNRDMNAITENSTVVGYTGSIIPSESYQFDKEVISIIKHTKGVYVLFADGCLTRYNNLTERIERWTFDQHKVRPTCMQVSVSCDAAAFIVVGYEDGVIYQLKQKTGRIKAYFTPETGSAES